MPSSAPDGQGGDGHALDDAVGERLQEHAVHERAGVALVAVADDVLLLARRPRGPRPTSARWGSPPRRGRAGRCASTSSMISSGESSLQAVPQGLEAVVAEVFVQVDRVELAAVLGGQVLLRAEERADRRVAHVDGVARRSGRPTSSVSRRSSQRRRRWPIRRTQPLRLEVRRARCRGRRRPAPGRTAATGRRRRDQLDQRRLVAHAHAADALDHGRRAGLGQRLADRLVDLAAALGHAAGAQADADLAQRRRPAAAGAAAAPAWPSRCCSRKSSSTSPTVLRRELAVGHAVDLDHRGQRAAAQAGDLLDGEQARRRRCPRRRRSSGAARRASWTSSEPFTWQAVPWQTLMMCSPTGRWRNCV